MKDKRTLPPRRALMLFLFAITGSVTGTLVGLRVVAEFQGTPSWLLPAILFVSVLLALVAAYAAFYLATSSKQYRASARDGEA